MHRIDTVGHVGNMFSDVVNEGTGQFPTIISDDWLNAMQEEVVAVIVGAGIGLNKAVNTQLRDAINSRIGTLIGQYDTTLTAALDDWKDDINDAMSLFQTNVNAAIAANATRPGLGFYLTGTVIPTGARLVKADGSLVSRTGTYANLWAYAAASGNLAANQGAYDANPGMYGPGDGVNNFQLPTVEDFVRSLKVGRTVGSKQEDALQGFKVRFQRGDASSGGSHLPADHGDVGNLSYLEMNPMDAGYGAPRLADETRPKNIAYPFVITY